jgi:hypothetical protein
MIPGNHEYHCRESNNLQKGDDASNVVKLMQTGDSIRSVDLIFAGEIDYALLVLSST